MTLILIQKKRNRERLKRGKKADVGSAEKVCSKHCERNHNGEMKTKIVL